MNSESDPLKQGIFHDVQFDSTTMHPDCIECLVLQADKLIEKHKINHDDAKEIMSRFNSYMESNGARHLTTPEAACFLHRLVKQKTQTGDLYQMEKEFYNQLLLGYEEELRNVIARSDDPFQTALRYALAGNIIDFGPPKPFDVMQVLPQAASIVPAIDHSEMLHDEITKASMVLYLGDNAGEIVLDKLFIETINHPNLWFATRGDYIINDITLEDAEKVGMTNVAKVISNGYDAPSTILDRCSPEFKDIFEKADIVISKGQGNLEGLIDNLDKKIFFLLLVKCHVIGERIHVGERNTVVLFNQTITRL